MNKKLNRKTEKGFVLFLSLLIMSVALTIAFSVFEIFSLNITMGGNIKESQTAFYAADSGLECVYYWDIKQKAIHYNNAVNITCNNETKNFNMVAGVGNFQLLFTPVKSCATINLNFSNPSPHDVLVLGRSKYVGSDCNISFPRRAERGIGVIY